MQHFVRRRVLSLLIVALAVSASVLLHPRAAAAQPERGGAAFHGTVIDPDGKVVVGAALVIRNEATNDVRTTTSDGSGRFTAAGLQPGLYTIEVAVPGFALVQRSGIDVTTGTTEELSIKLSLANITEQVTVSVALPAAAVAAPSQASLMARSAQSLISAE